MTAAADLDGLLDGFGRRDWRRSDGGTVRVALIGLGWWTREHALPALEAAELCEATVAVSGSREKASSLVDRAATVERALTYDEFHAGAATDAYDAVYVSTPNALHLPFVETAAGLGKHVCCEKPMEASVERASRMVEAAADGGIELMIGYRMQTEPAVRVARRLVDEGFVGEPAHALGHMTQTLLETIPDPDQWRLDPDLAGPGAAVTDLGIYPLNTARFVLDRDPVSVAATAWSSGGAFGAVPDERASFEVALEGGVLGSFAASQNAHDGGRFEVVGTEGRLALEPAFFADGRRTLVASRGDASAEFAFDVVDQMVEEFDYFADRLLADAPIGPDGEHGLVDVRTIEAVYEAAETGARTPVD